MEFNKALIFGFSLAILTTIFLAFGGTTEELPMSILNISNQAPNITGVTLESNYSVPDEMALEANNITTVWCWAYVFDIDGYTDIDTVQGRIWDNQMSSFDGIIDNRWHYRNSSCNITQDAPTTMINARVNCTFPVIFYANYSDWNCTLTVNDTDNHIINGTDNATMLPLLAIDIVNQSIEWGQRAVDMDYDTDMNVSVENEGNIPFDLQIDAYNSTSIGVVSNYSFDCQIGYIPARNIVFNYTSGGIYAQSTRLSNFSYIFADEFDLYPQSAGLSPTNKSTYFGIRLDGWPTINGTCNGWMRMDAVDARP
jgi:hypothetical protein